MEITLAQFLSSFLQSWMGLCCPDDLAPALQNSAEGQVRKIIIVRADNIFDFLAEIGTARLTFFPGTIAIEL